MSSETRCNWRLSRAARDLVAASLRKALNIPSGRNTINDGVSIWQVLDQTVDPRAPESCPLVSLRDCQRRRQGSARVIPATRQPPLFTSRQEVVVSEYHQCGLCNKTFVSQYYLDQHLEHMHTEDDEEKNSSIICPAVHYCEFLSLPACYDRANLLEPNYNNAEKRTKSVPCRSADIQQANTRCDQVVEACFSHNQTLQYTLHAEWCSYSCQDRWAQWIIKLHSASSTSLSHYWFGETHEELWHKHANDHFSALYYGMIVLVIVAVQVFRHYGIQRRPPQQPRSRLLQKKKTKTNLSTAHTASLLKSLRYEPPTTTVSPRRNLQSKLKRT